MGLAEVTRGGWTLATSGASFAGILVPGSPATVAGLAAGPMYSPAGAFAVDFDVETPPFPVVPLPPPDGDPRPMLPTVAPGLAAPPGCPSGEAVNVPRRLPAGGSGGASTAGCRFKAIRRPPEPDAFPAAADPLSVGGGATTCGAAGADCLPPPTARWSATASCGAGAMTAD